MSKKETKRPCPANTVSTRCVATMATRDAYDNFIFTSENPETVEVIRNVQAHIHSMYPTCYNPVWVSEHDGKERAKITVASRMSDGRAVKADRGLEYKLSYSVVCATSLNGKKYIKIVLKSKPKLLGGNPEALSCAVNGVDKSREQVLF